MAEAARRNPYPGLRPFRTDEEHLFFGREQQVDRMIDKLAGHRFLAVVGTSGSGKSSLVNCGLRPALHRGRMASAGSAWRMAQMRPGSDPIGALAEALAKPGVLYDAATLAEMADGSLPAERLISLTLRLGSLGLVDMVEQARLPAGTQLLVVADQFEELFRYRNAARDGARHGASEDATAFVQLLLEAAAQAEVAIHVVLTMRSDYLGDCAQFHGLPELMNESQYLVPRLTRGEIRAAISGPASLSGAQISPVLLTRLLNDVGDNPDQLSILQHALNRTWAHWANEGGGAGALALADYEAIGGMREALDRHAEKAFAELAMGEAAGKRSAQQQLAARVFRTITDKGTDARGIRRPTPMAQLCAICDAPASAVEPVLAVFRKASRSFLMPPEGEALQPGTRVDISHESLMRVWHRLDHWADEEAAAARQYRRLAESAELCAQGDAGLLTDRELDLALDWRRQTAPNAAWAALYGGHFEAVDDFIRRSREVRLAERVETEIDRVWRGRWRFAVIGVVALMFVVGQIWLNHQMDSLLTGEKLATGLASGEKLTGGLAQLRNATGGWRFALETLAHLLVGLPALLLYDLLEPIGRRLHARRVRDAVSLRVAAAADAAPAPASVSAPAPRETIDPVALAERARDADQAWMADPAARPGHLRRLTAGLIDLGLALVIWFFAIGIGIETGLIDEAEGNNDGFVVVSLLVIAGLGLMSALSLRSARQGTLGKRLLGLVVTDTGGQRLGFGRACGRHAAKLLSYLPYGLGLVPALFGAQRRALHDRLAGTRVLRRPPPPA